MSLLLILTSRHLASKLANQMHSWSTELDITYSADPSPHVVLNALQQSLLSVQQVFSALNLVLNISKTMVMWFGKKNAPLHTGVITTSEGLELEVVTSYKCLGEWLDGLSLSTYQSCRLDLVSSIVIAPLSPQLPN